MTYIEFVERDIKTYPCGEPIYSSNIARKLAQAYRLTSKEASAAVSVAIKRLKDNKAIPQLRCFQKGIYYTTIQTPFGETSINIEDVISKKYLADDNGYETGLSLLHHLGLTTQLPATRVIATNKAKNCIREDKALGIFICPPKEQINSNNKMYLQTLDVIEKMHKAPIDVDEPYRLLADHIQTYNLDYGKLLSLADSYYNQDTILRLAHIAGERRPKD